MRYLDSCTAYSVKKCEKIDLNSDNLTWKGLSDMRESRWSFNPCLFTEYVYICGGNSRRIEAFSPETDNFLPISLLLPENSCACLYVHNNHLVVHSNNYLSKLSAGQAGQLVLHSQLSCTITVYKGSSSHPVLDLTRGLCFLFWEDRCVCFRMETGVVQKFP